MTAPAPAVELPPAVAALHRALRRLPGWSIADLHQLRPDSSGRTVVGRWGGARSWVRQDGSPVVEVRPWDDVLASLTKNQRSTVRRTLRRTVEDGVRVGGVGTRDGGRVENGSGPLSWHGPHVRVTRWGS